MKGETATDSVVAQSAVIVGTVGVKLAKALLAAQKVIESVTKDGNNPHFGNDYATLENVIDSVKKPLNDQGIVFVQIPAPTDGETLGITTMLIHESGEFISGTAVVPLQNTNPQGYGSAMTYARRYSLASVVGLKTVDDDAEGAVGRGVTNTKPASKPAPSTFKLGGGKATVKASAPARGKSGMFPKVDEGGEDESLET